MKCKFVNQSECKLMECRFVSRSECVQMEPSFRPSDSRTGRAASLEWPPVWCLPQHLWCQSQYREALKLQKQCNKITQIFLILFNVPYVGAGGGLYIYFPITPSRYAYYGDINASFGNASWSIIWALIASKNLYNCPCNRSRHLFDCIEWPLYLHQQCGHFVERTWLIRLSMLPR